MSPLDEFAGKPASAPVPPVELMKLVGSPSAENFLEAGKNLFQILRRHGGLKPSDRVLDVGCGCGRLAVQLADYLTAGSYDGFDVVPELVSWCRENIAAHHANFRFEHVDVSNTFYSKSGTARAANFQFPHKNDVFDITVLASVFTHMLRQDFMNYAGEIVRTLKPGGTALMTFFLINDESRSMKGVTMQEFRRWRRYERGGIRVLDPGRPEAGVSYPESLARSILRSKGLEVQQILYGSWCGRQHTVSGQDVVIARKPRPRRKPAAEERRGLAQRLRDWFSRS